MGLEKRNREIQPVQPRVPPPPNFLIDISNQVNKQVL